MKYMLLIYQGTAPTPRSPDAWARLSGEEKQEVTRAYKAVNETPGVSPGVVLQPADSSATTVRVQDDTLLTEKGPFVPLERALDGYLMFEADGDDAAIDLAASIPAARLGGAVEVRPLVQS